ncbi:MAG: type I-E CRISPR-associated endonuclease Cas1e [Chloroflexota bacterium]
MNYHELPKLRDSLSYLYVEHAILDKKQQAIEFVKEEGRIQVPTAKLSVLMLGPGTSITHAAVALLARSGTSVVWTGQDVTKFYAQGTGETRKGYRLLLQAELVSDAEKRLEVVKRMYQHRFKDEEVLDPDLSLQQIRGKEGARVRETYRRASQRYGVEWQGRKYKRGSWGTTDPVNRGLSAANALLNGLCHAAIVSGGYSAGLGFIHTGKQLSFVYDIADLYKAELTIPIAFEETAKGTEKLESRVRAACRQGFREAKLLQRVLPDIDDLLNLLTNAEDTQPIEPEGDIDEDGALPTKLWSQIEGDD